MARFTVQEHAELLKKQSHVSVERYFEVSLLLMLATAFLTITATRKLDADSPPSLRRDLTALRIIGYALEGRTEPVSPRVLLHILRTEDPEMPELRKIADALGS